MQTAEGGRQKAEGRKQKAESRRQEHRWLIKSAISHSSVITHTTNAKICGAFDPTTNYECRRRTSRGELPVTNESRRF